MSAASSIIINDGQGTPVAHTFAPVRKNGSLVEYEERTSGHTPSGFYTIGISTTDIKGSSPIIREKITLAVPVEVLDTVTNTYSYENTARFVVEVLIPKTLTLAARADLYAYLKNLMAHAVIQGLVKDLDAPY